LLPPKPKIFHGRDSELLEITEALNLPPPARIAILGAGGMGKTALARAVLHHPGIISKYKDRYFVTLDSATNSSDMAAIIGSHLELQPEQNLTRRVLNYLHNRDSPCLLILDNLETPWEAPESRRNVEEFLDLLTDIPHLALVVSTMFWVLPVVS
jgi:SpoVK/Ycf46/Vps4 family AAA+-type ATPase